MENFINGDRRTPLALEGLKISWICQRDDGGGRIIDTRRWFGVARGSGISSFLSRCRDPIVSVTLINRHARINFAAAARRKVDRNICVPGCGRAERKPPAPPIPNVPSNIKTDRCNSGRKNQQKQKDACATRELRE